MSLSKITGWIFKTMYTSSINPTKSGFATASFENPYASVSADNVLLWDSSTVIKAGSDTYEKRASLLITLSEPITIMQYKLQQLKNYRFVTNWTLEVSLNSNTFKMVDMRNENLCDTKVNNDCGVLTEKVFTLTVPRIKFNIARLTVLKDSCSTYYMHLGAIDFFVVKGNECMTCKRSRRIRDYISLSLLLSHDFLLENKQLIMN